MSAKRQKKTIEKIIPAITALTFLISPCNLALAEDYPAGYLGNGYRGYLSDKVQSGYYVEVFKANDTLNKVRVDNRNKVEEMVSSSYQTNSETDNGILAKEFERKDNSNEVNTEILQHRQEREKVANVKIEGGFTYIPYSDGKIVYFKDGLPIRIENERVTDEFGNVAIKNTSNMQYNERRLLTSYEATLKDHLGNVSKLFWYGANYTNDSVYYGDKATNANKNLTEYYLKEIDSAGNVKLTHWHNASYEGKVVKAYSQRIEDSIYGVTDFSRSNIAYAGGDPERLTSYAEKGVGTDGLTYTSRRNNTTYNEKGQVSAYNEEKITTHVDGGKIKTITDAQFKYLGIARQFGADVEGLEPDRLLESLTTMTTENPDGSKRTETDTAVYQYEGAKLIGAKGNSEFSGKETNSNTFKGASQTEYELSGGRPIAKKEHSLTSYYNFEDGKLSRTEDSTLTYNNGFINNLQRVLTNNEHTEIAYPLLDPQNNRREIRDITSNYSYDQRGNLIDAKGTGKGTAWEYSSERGWWGKHKKAITIDNEVILGKTVRKKYNENKQYD